MFSAEIESLSSDYNTVRGRYARRGCNAVLGDARCQVDLEQAQFAGAGTVAGLAGNNAFLASGLDGFAAGWFGDGTLHWLTGANAGADTVVAGHRNAHGVVTLMFAAPPRHAIAEGDSFTIRAGCDRSFETCRKKFANGLNFQGFPHIPGNDSAYSYVSGDAVFDGGPVVP